MPWTMEGAVMPDREAPVRECPLCAPGFVRCAHFEGHAVMLGDTRVRVLVHSCDRSKFWFSLGDWVVVGPTSQSRLVDCYDCGTPMGDVAGESPITYHPTEAEGRAEFDRRVALMLGREVA